MHTQVGESASQRHVPGPAGQIRRFTGSRSCRECRSCCVRAHNERRASPAQIAPSDSSSVTAHCADGPTFDSPRVLTRREPWPSLRTVLPALLTAKHGHVHHPVAPEPGSRPLDQCSNRSRTRVRRRPDIAGEKAEISTSKQQVAVAGRVPGRVVPEEVGVGLAL